MNFFGLLHYFWKAAICEVIFKIHCLLDGVRDNFVSIEFTRGYNKELYVVNT